MSVMAPNAFNGSNSRLDDTAHLKAEPVNRPEQSGRRTRSTQIRPSRIVEMMRALADADLSVQRVTFRTDGSAELIMGAAAVTLTQDDHVGLELAEWRANNETSRT